MKTLTLLSLSFLIATALHAQIFPFPGASAGSGGTSNVHVVAQTAWAESGGVGGTVSPATGVNCTGASDGWIWLTSYTLGSNPTPANVYDTLGGTSLSYTPIATPSNTGTTKGQWWHRALTGSAGSINSVTFAATTVDYAAGTFICVSGEVAIDGSPQINTTPFALPFTFSMTPTNSGEMAIVGCSSEITSGSPTLSASPSPYSANATSRSVTLSSNYGGIVSYKDSLTAAVAETPQISSSAFPGPDHGSCMGVLLK
jgi:hypothetical protein